MSHPDEQPYRDAFVDYADDLVVSGVPYIWDGKDPDLATPPSTEIGLDCSGCYCWCLKMSVWVMNGVDGSFGFHSSSRLHELLEPATEAEVLPGDAVFYGKDGVVNHVMAIVGDGRIVGARGGGPGTTTVAIAKNEGAGVQYRDLATYDRSNLIGFGRMPIEPPAKENA